MYDFKTDPGAPKAVLYDDLILAAKALVADEADAVANMANVAALLWQFLPDVNWTGFYRMVDGDGEDGGGGELVLGPFVGKPACIRIPVGQGVCGAAAESRATQLVADVHAFPGHIACDGETKSELVVPVIRDGAVVAVIDLDSPNEARFDEEDRAGIERLAEALVDAI
jgi:GAF domain-containing protein